MECRVYAGLDEAPCFACRGRLSAKKKAYLNSPDALGWFSKTVLVGLPMSFGETFSDFAWDSYEVHMKSILGGCSATGLRGLVVAELSP